MTGFLSTQMGLLPSFLVRTQSVCVCICMLCVCVCVRIVFVHVIYVMYCVHERLYASICSAVILRLCCVSHLFLSLLQLLLILLPSSIGASTKENHIIFDILRHL